MSSWSLLLVLRARSCMFVLSDSDQVRLWVCGILLSVEEEDEHKRADCQPWVLLFRFNSHKQIRSWTQSSALRWSSCIVSCFFISGQSSRQMKLKARSEKTTETRIDKAPHQHTAALNTHRNIPTALHTSCQSHRVYDLWLDISATQPMGAVWPQWLNFPPALFGWVWSVFSQPWFHHFWSTSASCWFQQNWGQTVPLKMFSGAFFPICPG